MFVALTLAIMVEDVFQRRKEMSGRIAANVHYSTKVTDAKVSAMGQLLYFYLNSNESMISSRRITIVLVIM